MSQTRIYVVIDKGSAAAQRLIEATSAAQAIRHCVANVYSAKAASPKDIAIAMQGGMQVEKANESANQPTHKTEGESHAGN